MRIIWSVRFAAILLAASAAAQPTQVRDTLPVPDVPGYKTLKCDFHMHTVFSDGEVWPITRLVEAFRDGLDAIAITDHATYFPHKDDVKPDPARPYQIARTTAQQLGIVLANSDVHRPMYEQGRKRPVTLVFARTADAEGIKEALLARRTAAWVNGEVWGFEAQLAALWSGSVKAQPAGFSAVAGRGAALRLVNGSAIPFKLQYRNGPAWLKAPGASLGPESTTGLALAVAKDAPEGAQNVTLEFEATNFHTGPGRNLTVKLPLTIMVGR